MTGAASIPACLSEAKMGRKTIAVIILFVFSSQSLFAQTEQPRLFDYFPRVPCGDMMARLDALLHEWRKNTENRIAVVYYGHRYRKGTRYGKNKEPIATELHYSHRDDGLNWAKGIPRYLAAVLSFSPRDGAVKNKEILKKLNDNILLINGGYRDELFAEIWIVPTSSELPKPQTYLTESQIHFGAKEPRPIPSYYECYAGY